VGSYAVTQVAAGTGLSGGGTAGNVTLSLANTTIVAGTYGGTTSIPVLSIDAQGRVNSAGTVSISYQAPLSFENGLTNSSNTVILGGNLNRITTIGTSSFGLLVTGSSSSLQALYVSSNGNVTLGGTGPSAYRLNVNGSANFNTIFLNGSIVTAF
jgi:hypothetical protein